MTAEPRVSKLSATHLPARDAVPRSGEALGRAARFLRRSFVPLSVVIPVRHRELLPETLAACCRNAGGCELEFVVVHPGPSAGWSESEDVRAMLPPGRLNFSWQLVACAESEEARNRGAQAAGYEHILFLGEGLRPLHEDLFRIHASLHSACPEKNFVVLGSVLEPDSKGRAIPLDLGPLLHGPPPLTFLDYRHVASSNVSFKKALLRDWLQEGFSPDFSAALGGVELAYRLSRRRSQGLRIFYDPAAVCVPQRRRSLSELLEHQLSVGRALRLLLDRHPETAADFSLPAYLHALHDSGASRQQALGADYTSMLEGIKAWVRLLDDRAEAGSETCRLELLSAAFELCLLQGLGEAESGRGLPPAAGALVVGRFMTRLRRMLHDELSDQARQIVRRAPPAGDRQAGAQP